MIKRKNYSQREDEMHVYFGFFLWMGNNVICLRTKVNVFIHYPAQAGQEKSSS